MRTLPNGRVSARLHVTFIPVKILDVGCGANKYEGAIGLDNNPRTAADVIHDLGEIPYPFPDDEFDLIVSSHVVEHVPDVMAFVGELHRIAKPGANGRVSMLLQIIVVLIVVGVLLWLVNNYIPMDGKIKSILNVVVVIIVVLWLLQAFGLLGSLGGVHVN